MVGDNGTDWMRAGSHADRLDRRSGHYEPREFKRFEGRVFCCARYCLGLWDTCPQVVAARRCVVRVGQVSHNPKQKPSSVPANQHTHPNSDVSVNVSARSLSRSAPPALPCPVAVALQPASALTVRSREPCLLMAVRKCAFLVAKVAIKAEV